MRVLINIIACIAFGSQLFSFVLNALNMKKPETEIESLNNEFVLVAYICSLLSVPWSYYIIAVDIRIVVPPVPFLLHEENYIVITEQAEIINIRTHVKSERAV